MNFSEWFPNLCYSTLLVFKINFFWTIFQLAQVNLTSNTQALQCKYDPNAGGYWSPDPIPCEQVTCRYPPPAAPAGSFENILFSLNKTTNQLYQTTIAYMCPANMTLPSLISSNFSLDYSIAKGFVYNVTAYCQVDG